MPFLSNVLLVIAGLSSLALGAVIQRDTCSEKPTAPSEDPWYSSPYGFETEKPGTILRIRPAPGNLTSATANCSAAYNILYRTTDSHYKPAWAITTLFVPANQTAALLSYQIAYDSADVDASPSYSLYTAVPADVTTSLGKGWFVSVPDYEGPLASFCAGVTSGHAVIDSIRAIMSGQNKPFQLPENSRYALWGYSGGALASEWAAELQVQYAPELNISGAALGGLTPNISSVLETISGSYAAGLAPAAILGITSQYPEVQEYVISKLVNTSASENRTEFLSAWNMTLNQSLGKFAFQNISEYFVDGFADIFNTITEKVIYADGIMGYHGIPQMHIFAYKAVNDLISPINDTDKLVNEYCSMGVNILYQRNSVGGHSAESTNGQAAAMAWIDSILTGTWAEKYNTTGCTIENVAVNITSSAFK